MISVIIPAFDEAVQLPATLASVRSQDVAHEVVVDCADSADSTAVIAEQASARVLGGNRRQRAAQMNAGARIACGESLLFLHADTRLPAGALAAIQTALTDAGVVGGGFARRYDSPSLFLRVSCALAELRTRACGWFLGDQAIFVRRSTFEELGGFREWDRFEDLDFSRRLADTGRVVTLRPPVISAARRFARGAARTTWSDFRLTVRYLIAGSSDAPATPPTPHARDGEIATNA